MNTALVKPSKIIKDATARVRADQDTIERARSVYTDAIKRALPQEAPYPGGVVTTGAPIDAADDGAEAAGAESTGGEAADRPDGEE